MPFIKDFSNEVSKKCLTCGETKSLSSFYKRGNYNFQHKCISCEKKYYHENKSTILQKEKLRSSSREARDKINRWRTTYRKNIRYKVLGVYSVGGIPHCNCCGETTLEFLDLDHIHGRANDIYSQGISGKKGSRRVYDHYTLCHRLVKFKFPIGYQVLCRNCNWGKFLGSKSNSMYCIHKSSQIGT